jgi:hypothetical protein
MLGGELWWTPNMAVYGVSSASLSPQEPLGWGYGRMLERPGDFLKLYQIRSERWDQD